MILLGFTSPRASPEVPARSESTPRDAPAQRIVEGMKAFFRALGQWEAHFLWSESLSFQTRFANVEADSIGARNLQLVLNLGRAQAARYPYRVSWVFERLHELASDSTQEIEVWFIPFGPNTSFTGQTLGARPNISVLLHHLLEPLQLGDTVSHELAIHAWRRARWGLVPASRNPLTSGHADAFHITDRINAYRPSHTASDVEADVLQFVLFGRPQRIRGVSTDAQRHHDRYSWQMYDSVVAAYQGNPPSATDLMPNVSPEAEYRIWRMFTPSHTGAGLRRPGPVGSR